MAEAELYQVYLAQSGANLTTILSKGDVARVQDAIHKGRPFGVWMRSGGKRLTGLTVSPMVGGLTLSISPPTRIPMTKANTIAQRESEVDHYLEPKDQPRGELAFPGWGELDPFARIEGAKAPEPEQAPEATDPPGPGAQ